MRLRVRRAVIALALACAPRPAADPELAEVALALVEAKDACGRMEGMRALLDALDWGLPPAEGFDPRAAAEVWAEHARATGRVERTTTVPSPWSDLLGALHREAEGMLAVAPFVSRFPEADEGTLVGAVQRCVPPEGRRAAIGELIREVEARGLGGDGAPVLPLRDRLGWADLRAWALAEGGSAPTSEAIAPLMEGHPELAPHARSLREQRDAPGVRAGIAGAQLEAWQVAYERGDLMVEGARCEAADRVTALPDKDGPGGSDVWAYAILRDLGCIRGVRGRFADIEAVRAWVRGAPDRARPWYEQPLACAPGWERLPVRLGAWEGLVEQQAYLLNFYYGDLVYWGACRPRTREVRP